MRNPDASGVPCLFLEMRLVMPRLRRYALALTRNQDEADDLVHDCLLRAMENHARWRPGTSLRAWMLVIMRNIHFNKLRHLKHVRKSEPELHLRQLPGAGMQLQDTWVELVELQRAVNKLPVEQREVLMLIVIDEHSYKTVADMLAIPIGTVRSRLSRARSKLALEFGAQYPKPEEPAPERHVLPMVRDGGSAEERID